MHLDSFWFEIYNIPGSVNYAYSCNRGVLDPPAGMLAMFKVLTHNFLMLSVLQLLSEMLLYSRVCISQVDPSYFYMLRGFIIICHELRIVLIAWLFFLFFLPKEVWR